MNKQAIFEGFGPEYRWASISMFGKARVHMFKPGIAESGYLRLRDTGALRVDAFDQSVLRHVDRQAQIWERESEIQAPLRPIGSPPAPAPITEKSWPAECEGRPYMPTQTVDTAIFAEGFHPGQPASFADKINEQIRSFENSGHEPEGPSDYSMGFLNGLELALATAQNRSPCYPFAVACDRFADDSATVPPECFGPAYPIRHPGPIDQFAEFIYVWYDETEGACGASTHLCEAQRQQSAYADCLDTGGKELEQMDALVSKLDDKYHEVKDRVRQMYNNQELTVTQVCAILGEFPF